MKKTSRAVVAGALGVFMIAGCSGADKPAAPSDTSRVVAKIEVAPAKVQPGPVGKFGGRLSIGGSDPKTFNPLLAQETSSSTPMSLVFDGLTTTNGETGEPEGALAYQWQVSPDGLTYTFDLRENLKWSDGQPLTADDVVFTFNDLVANPKIPSDWGDVIKVDGKLPTVKKVDADSVSITTAKVHAPFLRVIGAIAILPKHVLEPAVKQTDKTGAPKFNQTWGLDTTDFSTIVGTGPFMFKEYKAAQRLVMTRNPYHWRVNADGERLPYFDEVILQATKDQDSALLKFQGGETDIHMADASLRGKDYALMKPQEKSGNFTIHKAGEDFSVNFLTFNQNRDKNPKGKPNVDPVKQAWFNDVNFRKAVAHAVDKDSLVKNVYQSIAGTLDSALSPASPYYSANVPKYSYDLAKAQQILDAAGYKKDASGQLRDPKGHAIEFTLMTNVENRERLSVADTLKTDLGKLGMKIKVQPMQFNTLIEKTDSSLDWEAIVMGFTGSLDPALGSNIWKSDGRLHMFNMNQKTPATPWEAEIDRIFDEAATTLDEGKRKELYAEFQTIVAENLPYIYTTNRIALYPIRNTLGNVKITKFTPMSGMNPIWNLYEVYRK
jgi:peptide/nickel transport system substrate-binding protein